jgi:DNA polymerase (family 10)
LELEKAEKIASQVIQTLKPYCEKIEVAGSIRRKRPFVHDVDLVAIPRNQGQFITRLNAWGKIKMGGQKLIRCDTPDGIELDVYIATPETWACLLLIRTGSKQHNIRLCRAAVAKDMRLHADGSGLFELGGIIATKDTADGDREENRIAGDTEFSIFEALGLPYKRPEERE